MRNSSWLVLAAILVMIPIPQAAGGGVLLQTRYLDRLQHGTAAAGPVSTPPGQSSSHDSLWDRISQDLQLGEDIVITSYVGLWYQYSDNPIRNLYWGALYGHEAMFRGSRAEEAGRRLPFLLLKGWETLRSMERGSDPVAIKVFAASVPAAAEDTTRRGRVVVVALAYEDMVRAVLDMGFQLKTGRLPEAARSDPVLRLLLEKSYLMGYWGHNIYYGGMRVDRLETIPSTRTDGPRGVFMIGCQSARWYPQKFLGPGIEPLLFTITNMAPEAYIALALYDGIGRGLTRQGILESVAEAYRIYQRLRARPRLFVNNPERVAQHAEALPGAVR